MSSKIVSKEIRSDTWILAGLLALGITAPAIAADHADAAGREACFREPTSRCVVLQALRATEGIKNAGKRLNALASITEAQAEAGDISGALKTAKDITSANFRAQALGSIAEAQAKAGDIAGALKTTEGIAKAFNPHCPDDLVI